MLENQGLYTGWSTNSMSRVVRTIRMAAPYNLSSAKLIQTTSTNSKYTKIIKTATLCASRGDDQVAA